MRIEQVAAQLYTARAFLKTPADIAASLKKVKAIGYQAVQVSGVGPIAEEELLKMLKGEGLVCAATHEGNILTNTAAVIDRLKKLECRYSAVPHPGKVPLQTTAEIRGFAKKMNEAGKMFFDNGMVLTYHNHSMEFQKVDGRLILEIIYGETDPRYLQGEIDTYWVQHGGCDPVDWCERLKQRLPLLHMKDYMMTPGGQPIMCEIGTGNLSWKRIVKAAEESGCKWFFVEQDVCPGDPFESLKKSFDYIKGNLCT